MRRLTRVLLVPVVAAGLSVAAVPAFANDCFNASRSAQGDTQAAAHSGKWWSISETLTVLAGLNADQIAQVMPVINADPRIPANITFYADPAHLDRELASNMPDKNATNGTGIDHSDDYSTPILQAIFEDVAKALGAPA